MLPEPPDPRTLSARQKARILGGVLIAAVFVFLTVTHLVFYRWSDRVVDVTPGLLICRSDCTDYDNLSSYIADNHRFYPVGNDFHTSYFYRGFTLLVAVEKSLFGDRWKVSYIALNGLLMAVLAVAASRVLTRGDSYRPTLLILTALLAANIQLLVWGKHLLTDYIFAVGVALTFVFLAAGVGRRDRRYLLAALVVSLFMVFIRPSGLGLIAISTAVVLAYSVPSRFRLMIVLAVPPVVGLGFWVASASMTAYGADRVDDLSSIPESWPSFVQANMEQLLRFNYFGEEYVGHEDRLGALIVNFPYRSWSLNDGSPIGVMGSFVKRVPAVFEVGLPGFSPRHTAYRYLYYTTIYGLFLFYMVIAIRLHNKAPEHLVLVSLLIGHIMILVATSHITLRFGLPTEILLIIGSAFVVGRLLSSHVQLGRVGGRLLARMRSA